MGGICIRKESTRVELDPKRQLGASPDLTLWSQNYTTHRYQRWCMNPERLAVLFGLRSRTDPSSFPKDKLEIFSANQHIKYPDGISYLRNKFPLPVIYQFTIIRHNTIYINLEALITHLFSRYILTGYLKRNVSPTDKIMAADLNYYVYTQYGNSDVANAVAFAFSYTQYLAIPILPNQMASRDHIWYNSRKADSQTNLTEAVIATTQLLPLPANGNKGGACTEDKFHPNYSLSEQGQYVPKPSHAYLLGSPSDVQVHKDTPLSYTDMYCTVPLKYDSTDIDLIKFILLNNRPLLFRFAVFRNFYTQELANGNKNVYVPVPHDENYCNSSENFMGYHAVAVVGWSESYVIRGDDGRCGSARHVGAFICRNSWGPLNGDVDALPGHFYLPYDFVTSKLKILGDGPGETLAYRPLVAECCFIDRVTANVAQDSMHSSASLELYS